MANQPQEILTPLKVITFTNNDIVEQGTEGKYYFYCQHDLNAPLTQIQWIDNLGHVREHTGNIKVLNANAFILYTSSPITGTHQLTIWFDNSKVLKGERLFDQPLIGVADIDETYRIAIGRNGFDTKNVSFRDFAEGIGQALSVTYLRKENNLSEFSSISDKESARSNLDVYSKAESNARYLGRADAYNLYYLSQNIPINYPDSYGTQGGVRGQDNSIVTYKYLREMEHTSINNVFTTTTPWTVIRQSFSYSMVRRLVTFSVTMTLGSADTFGYTTVGEIDITNNTDLKSLVSDFLNNSIITSVYGQLMIDSDDSENDFPLVSAQMIIKKSEDGNSITFEALNQVQGRSGMQYVFNGTIMG